MVCSVLFENAVGARIRRETDTDTFDTSTLQDIAGVISKSQSSSLKTGY